jgi:V/A-type H+/Na+-transporting ATPase subunit C
MVSAVYAYANARSKALQSDLIGQAKLESLAGLKDFDEISHELNLTLYKEDLAALSVKYSGADLLEAAINRNLVRALRTVISLTPRDAKDVIALILGRWDIRNINLVIASKALGYSFGSQSEVFLVSSHDFPLGPIAGSLSYYDLKSLIDMKDIATVVEWVGIRYGTDLEPALEKYRTDADIGPLLLQIELAYLRRLVTAMSGRSGSDMRVLGAIKGEIDAKNLMAVLKAKQRDLNTTDVSRFTVEGGNISKQTLAELFRAAGVEELVENLKPYYDLMEGLNDYRTRGLVVLENLLTKRIAQKTIASLRVAPPSISSIVAYIMLKELEVENLTKIIRGKDTGVPETEIKASLVFA